MLDFEKSHFGAVGPIRPFGPKSSKNSLVTMKNIFFHIFQPKIKEKTATKCSILNIAHMGPAGYRGPKWPEIGSNRPKLSKSVFFMIFQPKTSKTYAEISSSNFGTIFGHFGQNGPFWPWCPNFRSWDRAEMKSATQKTPGYQISEGSGGGAWETVLAPVLKD